MSQATEARKARTVVDTAGIVGIGLALLGGLLLVLGLSEDGPMAATIGGWASGAIGGLLVQFALIARGVEYGVRASDG